MTSSLSRCPEPKGCFAAHSCVCKYMAPGSPSHPCGCVLSPPHPWQTEHPSTIPNAIRVTLGLSRFEPLVAMRVLSAQQRRAMLCLHPRLQALCIGWLPNKPLGGSLIPMHPTFQKYPPTPGPTAIPSASVWVCLSCKLEMAA